MKLQLDPGYRVGVVGQSAALDYAAWLLRNLGVAVDAVEPVALERLPADVPLLAAGAILDDAAASTCPLLVRVWDFQVGLPGSGIQACAVSGVSWVIGLPGRPPLYLPAQIPEKWAGTLAASMVMTRFVEQLTLPGRTPPARVIDVAAAEILRGFADQNFGNHKQIPTSWRRNGRVSPEHGGIFPQGFFPCKDGYVGVIGRSRQDWTAMLAALDNPEWSNAPGMRDPFALARDSSQVEPLFRAELERHDRADLLRRALAHGATFAPVYEPHEVRGQQLVRDDYFDAAGLPGLPFELVGA